MVPILVMLIIVSLMKGLKSDGETDIYPNRY